MVVISLVFGFFRWVWWTPLIPAAAGLGFEISRDLAAFQDLTQVDGEVGWMLTTYFIMLVASYACYAVGIGVRFYFGKQQQTRK